MATANSRRTLNGVWLKILAIGSVVCALLLLLVMISTDRGALALQRIGILKVSEKASSSDAPNSISTEPENDVESQDPQIQYVDREVVREVVREVPTSPPAPTDSGRALSSFDTRKLYNGIQMEVKLEKKEGQAASMERSKDSSYKASFTLSVNVPKPVTTLDGLESVQSGISLFLPGLPTMMETHKISPYYDKLYANKEERVRRDMLMLDKLLSRHNYYDCETFLELRHPTSGRKVVLLQAEMDVVSDGSDGDRLPEMPDSIVNSAYYQPTTSYGWPKKTDVPNPLVAGIEKRVKAAKDEYAIRGLTAQRNAELKSIIDSGTASIGELKRRSFLIAEYDPFIVLPVFVITDSQAGEYPLRVGDYAVVIYGEKLYPAIVGDAGPNFKVGEASLRIGKHIDDRTSPYRRPVNDLKATYLVFPGTAEDPKDEPNLKKWHEKCAALLGEIGGIGAGKELHQWEDILGKMKAEREAKKRAEEEAARLKAEEEARKASEAAAKLAAEAQAKAEAVARPLSPAATITPTSPADTASPSTPTIPTESVNPVPNAPKMPPP